MNINSSAAPLVQPHALMQKRSDAPSHDIRGSKAGPSSAFADYLFGPASSGGNISSSSKAATPLAAAAQAIQNRA